MVNRVKFSKSPKHKNVVVRALQGTACGLLQINADRSMWRLTIEVDQTMYLQKTANVQTILLWFWFSNIYSRVYVTIGYIIILSTRATCDNSCSNRRTTIYTASPNSGIILTLEARWCLRHRVRQNHQGLRRALVGPGREKALIMPTRCTYMYRCVRKFVSCVLRWNRKNRILTDNVPVPEHANTFGTARGRCQTV